jgi:predicted nucleic acid-binding protein
MRYLADVSAFARLHLDDVVARIGPLILAGEVASSGVVDLELLATARTADAHAALRADRAALPHVPLTDADVERAIDVQGRLAARGVHRDISISLLLVAAIAERAALTLLHDDPRLALVAEVTGQPTERATGS